MSIFTTRTSAIQTFQNGEEETALLLDTTPGAYRPYLTLHEDMDEAELQEGRFAASDPLTAVATYVRAEDEHLGDSWPHHVFKVQMRYQGRRMQASFRVGLGWAEAPSAADVLRGMIDDYRLTEHDSADTLGYTPERARQIGLAIDKQTARLLRFIPGL